MNERTAFETALEKEDPAERAAYLDKVCAGDAALRQRVEELLRSHVGEGPFLEFPAVAQLAASFPRQDPLAQTQGEAPACDTENPSLDFLAASEKPDSLGRLGHYEVLATIGRGGMGVVLKAFDEQLHRNVAIKVMAPQLATNGMARRRFVREARAAAAVRNDHVIDIHAVEETNELPYLAMEYVAGASLQERLDKCGPLQVAEILRIGMQTAAGLAAAHAQGLIHRDIKPSNILLENGVERVKITDFGLARAVDDISLTQSGVIAGTPQYMSPEQARGEAVDHRADLFSLGSVLYAMCTGRAPFRASGSMAVLKRVCEDTPRPIKEVNPEIPEWLAQIVSKLQAKDPAERFQSAAEVADLLSKHLAHMQHPPVVEQVSNLPADQTAGLKPTPRRRRLAVAAAVFLCLVAGLSLTEATGVTNLRATVIRIFTPDGTLVVETNDPGVKVTIEGDGGLVITGAGPQEVRLRPGSYKIQADKDGKRVPLEKELVSITKGGREVVRVKLEGLPAPAATKAAKGAFVLLAAGKEHKFDTLAEAVVGASDGDIIEIRGNGPFVTHPILIGRTALTIRAAAGYRPVLKYVRTETEFGAAPLQTDAPLVLEGLEIQFNLSDPRELGLLIHRPGSSFFAANCRFLLGGGPACVWNLEKSKRCVLRNCEVIAGIVGSTISGGPRSGFHGLLDNCLLVTTAFDIHVSPDTRVTSLEVKRTTLVGALVHFYLDQGPKDKDELLGPWLRLNASSNILDLDHLLSTYQGKSSFANGKPLPSEKFESLLRGVMTWQGEHNVYPDSSGSDGPQMFLIHSGASGVEKNWLHGPKDLAAWSKFWGSPETGAIQGKVRYQGGDLRARVAAAPEKLTPEDFRLRPNSAGYRAGKDGKDLGADVDLVGPGPAYERWKKTPEYQQWLKDSGQKKGLTAIKPEAKAFVVLGGKGVAERKFDTLAEAVQGASDDDGDTIEIRGNGPFVTHPISIGAKALTIRAAAGYRPVLQCVRTEAEFGAVPLRTDAPLVLEGIEIQLKLSDPRDIGILIRPGSSLFAANCRFRLSGGPHCVWNEDNAKRCVLRNCEVIGHCSAISGGPRSGFHGLLDNCLLFATAFDTHVSPDLRVTSLEVKRTTLVGGVVVNFYLDQGPKEKDELLGPWLRLNASSSIFDYHHLLSVYQDKSSFANGKPLPSEKLEILLRGLMAWHGEQNVCSSGMFLIESGASGVERTWLHGPKNLTAWGKFWGSPETGAIMGKIRYQGGNLTARVDTAPEKLTPDDFRLRPDSAGYKAGKDGKDLGADVDLVGPGPAYERWRKTPAYQQWLKDSGQVKK